MNKMTNALMRKKYPATLTLEEVFKQVLNEHKYLLSPAVEVLTDLLARNDKWRKDLVFRYANELHYKAVVVTTPPKPAEPDPMVKFRAGLRGKTHEQLIEKQRVYPVGSPERQAIGARLAADRARETRAVQEAQAAAFKRMVEALDLVEVNGKRLGDCTGADLLRAAVEAEEEARRATVESKFYRQLAALVGKTETVRQASGRDKVVALLEWRKGELEDAV